MATRARKQQDPTSARHENRKQQREEKLRQYGIDLPDIPGLPVKVIPLHMHAVKVTAKLFSKNGTYQQKIFPISGLSRDKNEREDSTAAPSSLLGSILQRVGESRESANTSPEHQRTEREQLKKHQDGVSAWLNAIHRCVRIVNGRNGREQEGSAQTSSQVPVAAIQHLLEIGLDHRRWPIRRATLLLVGKLFEKSADCRKWFLESREESKKLPLMKWMDSVLSAEEEQAVRQLWQREAYELLVYLEEKGYGEYYPTLSVALQRFQQLCPRIFTEATGDSESAEGTGQQRNMLDWRQLRSGAMNHYEEMDRRLAKVIRRAQYCMDVLVPRMDSSTNRTSTEDESKNRLDLDDSRKNGDVREGGNDEQNGGDDEDDNDSIDWEEGWDDRNQPDITTETHVYAVERTIQAMESTGGMHEGALEISFSEGDLQNDNGTENSSDSDKERAKARLDKAVKTLLTRYMPRLSLWVEGLTNADALVPQTSGALITMSPAELHRRRLAVQHCVAMKNEVSRVLSSAQRLGMHASMNNNAEISDEARVNVRQQPIAIADLVGSRQNQRLASSLSTKRSRSTPRDYTRKRSNRIRVKFTKR